MHLRETRSRKRAGAFLDLTEWVQAPRTRCEEKAVEKKREYRNKWPIDPKHRVAGMLARSLWDEDRRFCEILNRYGSATPATPRSNDACDIFVLPANSNDSLRKAIDFQKSRAIARFSRLSRMCESHGVSSESERDKERENAWNAL